MPSKQSLLESYSDTVSLLSYAVNTHGVYGTLKSIKHEVSGQIRITACLTVDHGDTFEGIGADKREALADCISGRFPA